MTVKQNGITFVDDVGPDGSGADVTITAPIGQKPMAESVSVVIASDQTPIEVTFTPSAEQDVNLIEVGGVEVSLGQKASAASIPVVIASDQFVPIVISGSDITVPVQGLYSSGGQGELSDNIGVLPALATEDAPTYIDNTTVYLSTDLKGLLRITTEDVIATAILTVGSPTLIVELDSGLGSLSFSFAGTFEGSLEFFVSTDDGASFFNVRAWPVDSSDPVDIIDVTPSSATSGLFTIPITGFSHIRLTAALSSGSIAIALRGSASSSIIQNPTEIVNVISILNPVTVEGTITADAGTPLADSIVLAILDGLNDTVTIDMTGYSGVAFDLEAGLTGTVLPEYSSDGGVTWSGTRFYTPSTGIDLLSITIGAGGAQHQVIFVPGGAGLIRVRVSAYTSGTAIANLRATIAKIDPVFTKRTLGTSAGVVAFMVGGQDASSLARMLELRSATPSVSDFGLVVREAARGQGLIETSIPVVIASDQPLAASVTDALEFYVPNEIKPLSLTSDGRLRVSSIESHLNFFGDLNPYGETNNFGMPIDNPYEKSNPIGRG